MSFRISLGFGKQGIRNFHGCFHVPILPYFEIWVYGIVSPPPHYSAQNTSASQVNDCAVCRKSFISGQQDELLDLRLRDQHPVKRIAMVPRK